MEGGTGEEVNDAEIATERDATTGKTNNGINTGGGRIAVRTEARIIRCIEHQMDAIGAADRAQACLRSGDTLGAFRAVKLARASIQNANRELDTKKAA